MVIEDNQRVSFKVFYPTRILTASNAISLRDWARECAAAGVKILLVDFSNVSFMDSSGFGALVAVNQLLESLGSRLVLCSLQGQARMLFEMTHMESHFEIYSDRSEFEHVLRHSQNASSMLQRQSYTV